MERHEYLRAPEAARLLRLSCSTLAKMRMRGEGPPFSRAGRTVIYDRADLEAWLQERKVLRPSEYDTRRPATAVLCRRRG